MAVISPVRTSPPAVPLQWANGKPVARPAGSTVRFSPFVGFHVEVGKDPVLDALLTTAAQDKVEIRHQRPRGTEVVLHWNLGETVDFLPLTAGPVAATVTASLSNGVAAETATAGIGLRWSRIRGERSKLAVRGFVTHLWRPSYQPLVQLTVRSRMTDRLLTALLDHTRAAVAADLAVNRSLHPDPVSPAELWLPLGPGAETEFGSHTTATVTPLVSRHPPTLSREYLRSIWRSDEIWEAATAAWTGVQAWAREFPLISDDGLASPSRADEADEEVSEAHPRTLR